MSWKKRPKYFWLIIVGILILLNLIDAFFTLRFNELQLATEANPLMDYLLQIDPRLFFIIKFSLVSLSALFMYSCRHVSLARHALLASVLVYGIVNVIHIYGFIFLEGNIN